MKNSAHEICNGTPMTTVDLFVSQDPLLALVNHDLRYLVSRDTNQTHFSSPDARWIDLVSRIFVQICEQQVTKWVNDRKDPIDGPLIEQLDPHGRSNELFDWGIHG